MEAKIDPGDAEAVARTINAWLGNPLSRGLIKFVSGKGKNGNRLDLGLQKYAGFHTKMSLMDSLAYRVIKFTIDKGADSFGAPKEQMKEALKDTVFRRAIVNVLEGIAEFGVQRPQTIAAPFLVVWNFTHCCNLKCKHCLDYETPVLIAENGINNIRKIGEWIDALMRKNKTKIIEKDGYEILELKKVFTAYAMDSGSIKSRVIKRVMRKKHNGNLLEIKTARGAKIKVTPEHLFYTPNGWTEARRLWKGSYIAQPLSLKLSNTVNKVNLLHNLDVLSEYKLRIRGFHKYLKGNKVKLSKRAFPDVPKSTREGWMYGYGSMPLERFSILPNSINQDALEIHALGGNKYLNTEFHITPKFSRLCGYFVSDGNYTKNTHRLTFSNNEKPIQDDIYSILSDYKHSPYMEKHEKSGRATQIQLNSKLMFILFKHIFGIKSKRNIPNYFLNLNEENARDFLSACFSGDGSVIPHPNGKLRTINYYGNSKSLIEGIAYLLTQFGIIYSVSYAESRGGYTISIPASFCKRFYEKIGFSSKAKKDKLRKLLRTVEGETKTMLKILEAENLIFTPVREVKKVKPSCDYVYDLTVETEDEEGNYIAGIPPTIVHNCYESSDASFLPDELTTQEAKETLDKFKEAGVVAVAFSGGEPLMRKDFFEIAKYAKDNNFYVSVATNATLVTPEIAKKLKNAVDYVEISLDGFEKTHDEFRGIPGVWKRAVQGIRNCVAEGIDTCIATTVTKWNLKEIPRLIDFAEKDLKVNRMIFFNYVPTRRGKEIAKQDISPQEREKLLKLLYSKLIDKGCKLDVFSTSPQYAVTSARYADGPAVATHFTNKDATDALQGKTKSLTEFIGGCGCARLYAALEPNGDIFPCVGPDTYIQSTDGTLTKIEDLKVEKDPITCDVENLKLEPDFCMGKRKVKKNMYKIKTNTDIIYASANHPFFVLKNGKIKIAQLESLKKGDYLLKARKIPIKGQLQELPSLDFSHYKLTAKGISFANKLIEKKDVTHFARRVGITRDTLIEFLGRRRGAKNIGLQKSTVLKLCKILNVKFSDQYFEPSGFKEFHIPEYADAKFCQLLGYFIGDGYAKPSTGIISFKDSRKDVAEYYARIFKQIFNINTQLRKEKGSYQIIASSKPIAKLFSKILGLSKNEACTTRSLERAVPIIIQKNTIKNVKSFLRGLYDAEGSVGPRWISLTSGSKDLLNQTKLLMLRIGISTSNLTRVKGLGKGFKINIPLAYIEKFEKEIGFTSKEKNNKLQKMVKGKHRYPRYPLSGELRSLCQLLRLRVPQILNQSDISRDTCLKIIQTCAEKIKQIKNNSGVLISHEMAANLLSLERRKFTYILNRNRLKDKGIKKIEQAKQQRIEKAERLIKRLERLLNSDLDVDKIINISYEKRGHVYDIQTFKNHTFLANSFVVHNCVFLPIKIGNIKKNDLRRIWRSNPELKKMRDRDAFKGCGTCPDKKICGGCRARAYGYFGDIQGPDPGCMRNLKYWKEIQDGG